MVYLTRSYVVKFYVSYGSIVYFVSSFHIAIECCYFIIKHLYLAALNLLRFINLYHFESCFHSYNKAFNFILFLLHYSMIKFGPFRGYSHSYAYDHTNTEILDPSVTILHRLGQSNDFGDAAYYQ